MTNAYVIDLEALQRVCGSNEQTLVEQILASKDSFVVEALTNARSNGLQPEEELRAIVQGNIQERDPFATLSMLAIVSHHLGTPTTFMDETWLDSGLMTALDKAKVDLERGMRAETPWSVGPSPSGIPVVSVWNQEALRTLAREVSAAKSKLPKEKEEGLERVCNLLEERIATGKTLIEFNWM